MKREPQVTATDNALGGAPRRSGRPSSPVVSRPQVIEAAIQIIDEQGLDELSVRGLARTLGVTAPSLYHHFGDKEEILHEVVLHILADVRLISAVDPAVSWQSNMVASVMAYRRAFLKHPNAAPLLMTRPWRGVAHAVVNQAIQVLSEAGVPPELQMTICRTAEMLAFASAIFDEYSDNSGFGDVPPEYSALQAAIDADTMSSAESLETALRALMTGFSATIAMNGLTRS
jgi:AcrR family transcriptional regulator